MELSSDTNNNIYSTNVNPHIDPEEFYNDIHQQMLNLRAKCIYPLPLSSFVTKVDPFDYVNNTGIMSLLVDNASKASWIKSCSPDDEYHEVVFIWNVEEITLMSISYLKNFRVMFPDIDVYSLNKLTRNILKKLNNFTEEDICEKTDVVNIKDAIDATTDAMKQQTSKFSSLKQFYNRISNEFRDYDRIMNYEIIKKCGLADNAVALFEAAAKLQERFNNRWNFVKKSLELVNTTSRLSKHKKYANVVLTDEGVAYAASQLLVSQHSKEIAIENIYSTEQKSTAQVLKRIQKRFGEQCLLVYITSNKETVCIPKKLNIAIWEIEGLNSIEFIYKSQQELLLRDKKRN